MRSDEWHDHDWGSGTWITMVLLMLALLVTVAALLVVAMRRAPASPADPRAHASRASIEILEQRFARGEIDDDEYTRRRDLLRSQ